MKIPNDIIEKIKSSADIVDVIGEFIDLRKRGQNYIGLCPFHNEKTPSFTVSQDKGIYKCFGCGKAGNVFSFLQQYQGLNFYEAVHVLASKYGIHIPIASGESSSLAGKYEAYYEALKEAAEFYSKYLRRKEGAPALQYFHKRNFSDNIIEKFMLGFSPNDWDSLSKKLIKQGFSEDTLIECGLVGKNESGKIYDRFRGRAMFTIKDYLGRVVGFGARLVTDEKNQAKYINSTQSAIYDKSKLLYGMFESKNAVRDKKFAILVEGYADYLTLFSSGFENVIASSGTALTLEQLHLLGRFTKNICFCFDGDNAGINAALKGSELALKAGFDVSVITLPENDDPDSIIQKHGAVQMEYMIRDAESFLDFKYKQAKKKSSINTAAELSEFVKSTVKAIVSIPDGMQHDFYIRKLAGLLDLSESQLRQVYKFRGQFINELLDKERKSDSDDINPIDFLINSDSQTAINYDDLMIIPDSILNEERILIKYALKGIDDFTTLIERHDIGKDTFHSESAKAIFALLQSHSDKDDILQSIIDDENLTEKIKSLIIEIALHGETQSELWHKKFQADEPRVDFDTIIEDVKNKLKLYKIKKKLLEVRQLMINDSNNDYHKQRFLELLRKEKDLNSLIMKYT